MFKKLKWLIFLLLLSALESHATFSVPDRPVDIPSRSISSPTFRPTFAHFALFVVSSSSDPSGSLQGAGGVGGLVALVTADDTYVYCMDANGNVVQMLDASDGSVEAAYEYSPFGKLTSSSGAMADENPFRFSTKYWDNETGLGYWGMRYYHPDLGRWLSRDPLGEEGGVLLYGFVGNDPVGGVDLLGMELLVDGEEVQIGSETYQRLNTTSVAEDVLRRMIVSKHVYDYEEHYLADELELRTELVTAVDRLKSNKICFCGRKEQEFRGILRKPAATFIHRTQERCLWEPTNAGMQSRPGESRSAALEQLFQYGESVSMECYSAMALVQLEAVRQFLGDEAFDKAFSGQIMLGGASRFLTTHVAIPVGIPPDIFVGDWVYYANPNVTHENMAYRGENALVMSDHPYRYYGHPGVSGSEENILRELNAMTPSTSAEGHVGGAGLHEEETLRIDYRKWSNIRSEYRRTRR